MQDPSLLSVLPNLSIGVIAVISLAYVSLQNSKVQTQNQDKFLKTLDDRADKHENAMQEREVALRGVETEVRGTLMQHLTISAAALQENTKVLGRVVKYLEK